MSLVNNKINARFFFLSICILFSFFVHAQYTSIDPKLLAPDPEKEAKFLPYLAIRHGGMPAIEEWKKSNTVLYYKELCYYCESFYIKRNHLSEGITLDESNIDISRFESSRNENEEAIIVLTGFKDALVLLPVNKLIYRPKQ